MSDNGATKTVELSWELPQPPAKVWRALTEPELLGKWLMQTDLGLEVGQRFTFRQDVKPNRFWDGVVHCELLEAVPHERLRYTWRSGPLDTEVLWTLESTPSGGTRLELRQSGFQPPSVLKPFNALAYYGAAKGWKEKVGKKLTALLAGFA